MMQVSISFLLKKEHSTPPALSLRRVPLRNNLVPPPHPQLCSGNSTSHRRHVLELFLPPWIVRLWVPSSKAHCSYSAQASAFFVHSRCCNLVYWVKSYWTGTHKGYHLYNAESIWCQNPFNGKTSLYFCHGLSAKIVYTGSFGTIMIKIREKGPKSHFVWGIFPDRKKARGLWTLPRMELRWLD